MVAINNREWVKKVTKDYGNLVKKEMDIKHIYLYGSYARGNYSHDSDIDIAVVGDDFSGDPVEDILRLMKIRRKIDHRIEPRPFKTCDFNLNNPIAREIINTGIKII